MANFSFLPSTVSIKSTEDKLLHQEAHTQHRPLQEMLKAMEREETVCEARTTSGVHGERVQARPRLAEATRFYPARAPSAGSGDRSSETACYLGEFVARLRNMSLKVWVMRLKNKREKKAL